MLLLLDRFFIFFLNSAKFPSVSVVGKEPEKGDFARAVRSMPPWPGMWLIPGTFGGRAPMGKETPRDPLGGPGESLYLGKGLGSVCLGKTGRSFLWRLGAPVWEVTVDMVGSGTWLYWRVQCWARREGGSSAPRPVRSRYSAVPRTPEPQSQGLGGGGRCVDQKSPQRRESPYLPGPEF